MKKRIIKFLAIVLVFFSTMTFVKINANASEVTGDVIGVNWNFTQYDMENEEVTIQFSVEEGILLAYFAEANYSDDGLTEVEMFEQAKVATETRMNTVEIKCHVGSAESRDYSRRIYFFVTDENLTDYQVLILENGQNYFSLWETLGIQRMSNLVCQYGSELKYSNVDITAEELQAKILSLKSGCLSLSRIDGDIQGCLQIFPKGNDKNTLTHWSFWWPSTYTNEVFEHDFSEIMTATGDYQILFFIDGEKHSEPIILDYSYVDPGVKLPQPTELKWSDTEAGVCTFKPVDHENAKSYSVTLKYSTDGGNTFITAARYINITRMENGLITCDVSSSMTHDNAIYKFAARTNSRDIEVIGHSEYTNGDDIYDSNVPVVPEDSETPASTLIQEGGSVYLKVGSAYELGSGEWQVSGDTTKYLGGNTFYVSEEKEYEFTKIE